MSKVDDKIEKCLIWIEAIYFMIRYGPNAEVEIERRIRLLKWNRAGGKSNERV